MGLRLTFKVTHESSITRARPEAKAAEMNSTGFSGEYMMPRVSMKPKMAPVPMCTRMAHSTATGAIILVSLLLARAAAR